MSLSAFLRAIAGETGSTAGGKGDPGSSADGRGDSGSSAADSDNCSPYVIPPADYDGVLTAASLNALQDLFATRLAAGRPVSAGLGTGRLISARLTSGKLSYSPVPVGWGRITIRPGSECERCGALTNRGLVQCDGTRLVGAQWVDDEKLGSFVDGAVRPRCAKCIELVDEAGNEKPAKNRFAVLDYE